MIKTLMMTLIQIETKTETNRDQPDERAPMAEAKGRREYGT
jgi:hypothetical protein